MRKVLVVLATLGVSLGSPAVLPAEAAPALTIKVSTTKVEVGKPVRVSGKATNADPGDPVRIQVRKPGTLTWVTVKTVATTATRTYATRITLSAAGDNKIRVKSGKLLSPALTVTAYTWLRLTRQSFFAATSGSWLSGTVVLGTTSYPDSIWSSGAGAWYFNLDRCNRIRYVAGRSDEEATVQGQFVVSTSTSHEGGGTTNASHPVTGNPISVLDAIPEDDTRLYLSLDDFVDGPVAALGTLEVRCAAASLPQMHVSDVIS
ncbi:MAG TPA: hypothetical protein VFK41_06250 [Nocardioidaceae bacterium]|nr:hypothetical protein [Nocardioidaceae bacterium]